MSRLLLRVFFCLKHCFGEKIDKIGISLLIFVLLQNSYNFCTFEKLLRFVTIVVNMRWRSNFLLQLLFFSSSFLLSI